MERTIERPDWNGPVGLKGSNVTEGAAPTRRNRKGRAVPVPRLARRADHSDAMARDLDRVASAILRGDVEGLPEWAPMPEGWEEDLTEEDRELSDAHVSRWRAIPQVVDSDRSDVSDVDHVSETDRARPLRLETRVRTLKKSDGTLESRFTMVTADRTDRVAIDTRDDRGRVVERRYVEPMVKGARVRIIPPKGLMEASAVADLYPRVVVSSPRDRLAVVGHGRVTGAGKVGSKPRTLTPERTDAKAALSALLATLEVGTVAPWKDWHVSLKASGRTNVYEARRATDQGTVDTLVGPPRKLLSVLTR